MPLKEELFSLMERIATLYGSKKITVILCCESSKPDFCTMTGYINNAGSGTVMNVIASADTIQQITNLAFDLANKAARQSDNAQ